MIAGVLVTACGMAGCSYEVIEQEHARRISQQRTALLKRQPGPSCEYRAADRRAPARPAGEPASGEASSEASALLAKLDYERQCYRHAEIIARQRLTSLQMALHKAIRRAEGVEPH